MQASAIQQALAPILQPSLEAMGYRFVRLMWQGSDKRRVLQLMAERQDAAEMTVNDCAEISHMVSALLDVNDPIESAYELEVSSPGIDRPLMNEADFVAYIGHEVKLEMAVPQMSGRRRFRGVIEAAQGGEVAVKVDNEVMTLPLEEMANAKLVMTNALMKAASEQHQQRQAAKAAVTETTNNE